MKFLPVIFLLLHLLTNNIFSQEISTRNNFGDEYKFLSSFADSSSGQFFIVLDSLPENIYYPHNIVWDGKKWTMQIIFDSNFSVKNLKPAITKNGLLFFINPKLSENNFLIFSDGKWIYSALPPGN